jgi:alpha-tubulin suppressor-like RCC1 family protein
LLRVTASLSGGPLGPVSSLGEGDAHGCAVVLNQGYCWGDQTDGELGNGVVSPTPSTIAVQVTGLTTAAQISSNALSSCATLAFGGVVCWGVGGYGALGNGTGLDSSTPVVTTGLTSERKVSVGVGVASALRSDGTVSSWGFNAYGQVGDGTTTDRYTPVPVL